MADEFKTTDDSYVSRQGQRSEIPVQSDNAKVEDPIDAKTADSDAQLGSFPSSIAPLSLFLITFTARDEVDAIDESNIIKDRTRHAMPEGGYKEPGDNEGIPMDE